MHAVRCEAYPLYRRDGRFYAVACRADGCDRATAAQEVGEPSQEPAEPSHGAEYDRGAAMNTSSENVGDPPGYKAGFVAGINAAAGLHADMSAKYRAMDVGTNAYYHLQWARRIRELEP